MSDVTICPTCGYDYSPFRYCPNDHRGMEDKGISAEPPAMSDPVEDNPIPRWGIDMFAEKWQDAEGDWVEYDKAVEWKDAAVAAAQREGANQGYLNGVATSAGNSFALGRATGRVEAREQAAVAMAVIIDKALADPWTVTVGLEVVQELWDVVRVKSAPTNEDQHEDDGNHDGVGDEQDLVHPSTILPPAEEGKP